MVPSRLPAGGGGGGGDDALREYARPIPAHHAQFARLEAADASFEAGVRYAMDPEQARQARQARFRPSGNVGAYDADTHAASKAGFVMIRGSIGFVHTSGGVCRFGGHVIDCPCGMMHVS